VHPLGKKMKSTGRQLLGAAITLETTMRAISLVMIAVWTGMSGFFSKFL